MRNRWIVVAFAVSLTTARMPVVQAQSPAARALDLYNAGVRESSGQRQIALFRQSLEAFETFEGSVALADAILRGGGDAMEARRLCERAFGSLTSPDLPQGKRNQATALVCLSRTYRAIGENQLATVILRQSLDVERTSIAEAELRELMQPGFKSAEAIAGELDLQTSLATGSMGLPRGAVPIAISADVYVNFDFNKATLTADGMRQVAEISRALNLVGSKSPASVRFKVIGHTDTRGSDEYNLELSKRRAETVSQVLVSRYGVARDALAIEGHGKRQPLFSGDSEETNARNRRVEIQLMR